MPSNQQHSRSTLHQDDSQPSLIAGSSTTSLLGSLTHHLTSGQLSRKLRPQSGGNRQKVLDSLVQQSLNRFKTETARNNVLLGDLRALQEVARSQVPKNKESVIDFVKSTMSMAPCFPGEPDESPLLMERPRSITPRPMSPANRALLNPDELIILEEWEELQKQEEDMSHRRQQCVRPTTRALMPLAAPGEMLGSCPPTPSLCSSHAGSAAALPRVGSAATLPRSPPRSARHRQQRSARGATADDDEFPERLSTAPKSARAGREDAVEECERPAVNNLGCFVVPGCRAGGTQRRVSTARGKKRLAPVIDDTSCTKQLQSPWTIQMRPPSACFASESGHRALGSVRQSMTSECGKDRRKSRGLPKAEDSDTEAADIKPACALAKSCMRAPDSTWDPLMPSQLSGPRALGKPGATSLAPGGQDAGDRRGSMVWLAADAAAGRTPKRRSMLMLNFLSTSTANGGIADTLVAAGR